MTSYIGFLIIAFISFSVPRVNYAVQNLEIKGGNDGDIKAVPYQLSLRSMGAHICGAAIISENWALTGAQCVEWVTNPADLTLHAGSTTLSGNASIHVAELVLKHPNYDPVGKDYDIGVVKVKTQFPLGQPGIQKIELTTDGVHEGQIGIISGWGKLTENSKSMTEHLQMIEVPILSKEACKSDYSGEDVTDRMFCAGADGLGACDGDIGSPLVMYENIVGIASWSHGCGRPHLPNVYTDVAQLREWIRQTTSV